MTRSAALTALTTLPALLLCGCIVVPRSAEVYDPQCRTMVRQMVLDTAVLGTFGHCRNEGCAAMLAAMGVVTAASVVISGSVAVIGNIVYWAERRGACPLPDGAATAPSTAPMPGSEVEAPPARPADAATSRPPRPPRPPVVPGIVPLPPAARASSPP